MPMPMPMPMPTSITTRSAAHPNLRNTPRARSSIGTGARPAASQRVPSSHHCFSCRNRNRRSISKHRSGSARHPSAPPSRASAGGLPLSPPQHDRRRPLACESGGEISCLFASLDHDTTGIAACDPSWMTRGTLVHTRPAAADGEGAVVGDVRGAPHLRLQQTSRGPKWR